MFPTKKKTTQLVLRRALLLLTLFIALPCIAHSQTPSPCTGSQLSVKDEHSDNAMGGQRGQYYSFKNNAPSPCTLKGSPGFVLLGRAGYRIPGQKITHNDGPGTDVTLAPGGKAFFSIDYRSCLFARGAGVRERCVAAAKVRIEVPGTKRAFILRGGIDAEKLSVNVSSITSKDDTAP
ncbi:MAG TPA: DUF4232 domain-containing protein [Pyrinomonadaceae bacterium]|nr:DUF4232 domain-containing protein [Pyrinomonadaceae bacterium]